MFEHEIIRLSVVYHNGELAVGPVVPYGIEALPALLSAGFRDMRQLGTMY